MMGQNRCPLPPRFHFHPMTRSRLEEAEQLPRWLESQGIELYHAPDNGLHAFPSYTCPMLVTIHDLIPFVMPETVRRGYRRNFLEKVPKIAREAFCILTVSQVAKRDIHSILDIPGGENTGNLPCPRGNLCPRGFRAGKIPASEPIRHCQSVYSIYRWA